jgi:hypothetical protein
MYVYIHVDFRFAEELSQMQQLVGRINEAAAAMRNQIEIIKNTDD